MEIKKQSASRPAKKPVLVSGIQPSGRLHLGNYLGGLKNFVVLQNSDKYQCYFFIADLHSLTENYKPEEKRSQIINLMADYLAAGLDPKKSVIFLQSQVPAHTELAWILNTITPMGELARMTQYKEKTLAQGPFIFDQKDIAEEEITKIISKRLDAIYSDKNNNVGLFDYPVLMAADILLYGAKYVPVGDDQLQHLELTRTLARKFNSRFGETFIEPKEILTKISRLTSLNNPEKKMSKSDPSSCLFMDDSLEIIKEKIKRATTDSGSEIKFDREKKPAISNLIDIYSSLSGENSSKIETDFKSKNYSYFKEKLADVISEYFSDYRKKKIELLKNPDKLKKLITDGSKEAAKVASAKILEVKEKIGINLS
jgi:tryptophanyl-tRNA synthetase